MMANRMTGKLFVKNMLGFSVATFVNAFLGFIATAIVTRSFSTTELGKINLFVSYLNLFSTITLFGMDQSLVRFYNEPTSKNTSAGLCSICLFVSAIVTSIFSLIIILFQSQVSLLIVGEVKIGVTILMIVSVFGLDTCILLLLILRMKQKVLAYTILSISVVFVSKIAFVFCALWAPRYYNAITIIGIGYISIGSIFLFYNRKFFSIPADYSWPALKPLLIFGLPCLLATLTINFNSTITQMLLKTYLDYSAIGIYTSASTVVSILVLVQAGFGTYWTAFVYANHKTEKEKISRIHDYITVVMIVFGMLIILFQDAVYLIIGGAFKGSKEFFALLLMPGILSTIAETTGLGISISKKTYLMIFLSIATIIFNIVLCLTLLPILGAKGAALATFASTLISFSVKTIIGEKYYKVIKNKHKLVASIILIAIAQISNIYLYKEPLIRTILITVLIAVEIKIYDKQVIYLFNFAKSEIMRTLRRNQ